MVIDPQKDGLSALELIDFMGGDLAIVNDARASFNHQTLKLSEKDAKLIEYLIVNKHTSPFRSTVFKFKIKAPLYVARQWYKHVIASCHNDEAIEIYQQSCVSAIDNYHKLIELGVCREQARGVLPTAIYTTWIWTASLQSVLHFIKLRQDSGAQKEIRLYAAEILLLIKAVVPETIKIWSRIDDQ